MKKEDTVKFTTTPALASACKSYHTNVTNMWTADRVQSDLRVVIILLLRIHLAPKRFFRQKSKKKSLESINQNNVVNTSASNCKIGKTKAMRDLFHLLQRHNGDNFGNKLQVLQKLVDVIMKEKVKIPSAQKVEETAPCKR